MTFSGKRIRQVRELNGFTQTELAVRTGVSQGLIGQVERGLKNPSSELIENISKQTHFPIHFFTQDPPIEFAPESLLFRSHADTTQFQETEARRYAEVITEMAAPLLKMIEPLEIKLPSFAGRSPEDASALTRSALGLRLNDPIPNLVHEIEKAGVLILGIPAELPGRDAFTLWMDKRPIMALINGSSGARLRFSLAHEVGHIVLQHSRIVKADEEREAFQFASALLMPEEAMRREITTPVTLSSIAALKPRWLVSIQALVRRAKDLNIITDRQYSYLNAQISAKGWKKREPGEFATEKPRLLRQILEDVRGGSSEQLANELRMDASFIKDVIEQYASGSGPKHNNNLRTAHKVTLMKRR